MKGSYSFFGGSLQEYYGRIFQVFDPMQLPQCERADHSNDVQYRPLINLREANVPQV